MKHLKTYEQSDNYEYEIYYTQTKNDVTTKRIQYQILFDIDMALKKVKKLLKSFLNLEQTEPRFENWNIDDYWIEIYDGDERIQIIDKEEIDAIFDVKKYNL